MAQYLRTSADISDCGTYRHSLNREWENGPESICNFIMLNPSTANGTDDDPTIRRCVGFAESFGCTGLVVTNLFDFRATSPKDMKNAQFPSSARNDDIIKLYASNSAVVVCAWGAHGVFMKRDSEVLRLISFVCTPKYLALTKNDIPRHPLYLKGNSVLRNI